MGVEQSKTENTFDNIQGLQLVRVLPQSPAHVSGLLPFFDIITAIDQRNVLNSSSVSDEFRAYVAERDNQQICLEVYNTRMRAFRNVFCVPSRNWGGGGMLGCSVEWGRAGECSRQCFHIVEVLPGSPVDLCLQVKAERDYIIGIQRADGPMITLIESEDGFYDRVEMWRVAQREDVRRQRNGLPTNAASPGKLIFLIYDSEANEIRDVVVDLTHDVEAPLGVNLATGLLHLVPSAPEGVGLPVISFRATDGAAAPALPIPPHTNETNGTAPESLHGASHCSPETLTAPPETHSATDSGRASARAMVPALSLGLTNPAPIAEPRSEPPPPKQQQEQQKQEHRENARLGVACDGSGVGVSGQSRAVYDNYQPPVGFPKLPPPLQFPVIRPKTPTK